MQYPQWEGNPLQSSATAARTRRMPPAAVNGLDAIVSWNFKHIVKRKTIIMTEIVNERNGL
jgi:hypothetical protein